MRRCWRREEVQESHGPRVPRLGVPRTVFDLKIIKYSINDKCYWSLSSNSYKTHYKFHYMKCILAQCQTLCNYVLCWESSSVNGYCLVSGLCNGKKIKNFVLPCRLNIHKLKKYPLGVTQDYYYFHLKFNFLDILLNIKSISIMEYIFKTCICKWCTHLQFYCLWQLSLETKWCDLIETVQFHILSKRCLQVTWKSCSKVSSKYY